MRDKDNLFFIAITEPSAMRKEVLETSKELINLLKQHERFKRIREEKARTFAEMKHIILEINELNDRLKSKLPKAELKFQKSSRKKGKRAKESESSTKKEAVKMSSSQLNALEKELASVENKLNDLKL